MASAFKDVVYQRTDKVRRVAIYLIPGSINLAGKLEPGSFFFVLFSSSVCFSMSLSGLKTWLTS